MVNGKQIWGTKKAAEKRLWIYLLSLGNETCFSYTVSLVLFYGCLDLLVTFVEKPPGQGGDNADLLRLFVVGENTCLIRVDVHRRVIALIPHLIGNHDVAHGAHKHN